MIMRSRERENVNPQKTRRRASSSALIGRELDNGPGWENQQKEKKKKSQ